MNYKRSTMDYLSNFIDPPTKSTTLSKKEVLRLIEIAQGSDDEKSLEAKERLLEAYQGLIWKIAARYTRDLCRKQELHQVGQIGLMLAIQTFKPHKSSFISWAWIYVRRQMTIENYSKNTVRLHQYSVANGLKTQIDLSQGLMNKIQFVFDPDKKCVGPELEELVDDIDFFVKGTMSKTEHGIFTDFFLKGVSHKELRAKYKKNAGPAVQKLKQKIRERFELY